MAFANKTAYRNSIDAFSILDLLPKSIISLFQPGPLPEGWEISGVI